MIIEIKNFVDEKAKRKDDFLELVRLFNDEAIKQNSRYRMKFDGYPILIKKFWIGGSIPPHTVIYDGYTDSFKFLDGILPETFLEINSILDAIPKNFTIEEIK